LSAALLDRLAQRADHLGLSTDALRAAEEAMSAAQASWHRLAAEWGDITTETRFLTSPAMIEASDLLVRLGRLACDNPSWTPTAGHQAPLREPSIIAPDAAAAAAALAAVHHAACAFARVAAADLSAVRAARQADRLYVPVRTLPE